MELKIAPNDPQSMVQDGDAVLKSLQNQNLPIIDLVVRESIQNSLDAQIKGEEYTDIYFKINDFSSGNFAPHLNEVSEKLVKKFPKDQKVLSISDKNTSGLTGDYKTNNRKALEESDYQKLVFGLGKPQTKEGAGGSWGYGKTSYFQIGVGIVLYYTRIKTEEGYEERLIASLIEDAKDEENRILDQSDRGIAWWGRYAEDKKTIYPITDHSEINKILGSLNLNGYSENETGTMIIIPYLKKGLGSTDGIINEKFKSSIQRWYAPRIMNESYYLQTGNSQLRCFFNDMIIHPDFNMDVSYKYIRELYTSALTGESTQSRINTQPVIVDSNALENPNNPAGYISFIELTREDLKMTPPNNEPSILQKLSLDEEGNVKEENNKIIGYSRKPGMVVEYEVNGPWTPSLQLSNADTILVGFFVPVSDEPLLKRHVKKGYGDLEAYLRSTEAAVHSSWVDESGITIVRRIQAATSQAIQNHYVDAEGLKVPSLISGLSRKFGKLMMPPRNFGKNSSVKKDGGSNSPNDSSKRGTTVKRVESHIRNSELIDDTKLKVEIELAIRKSLLIDIYCEVDSQEKRMNLNSWTKIMGDKLDYPFKISAIDAIRINESEISNDDLSTFDLDIKMMDKDNVQVEYTGSDPLTLVSSLTIEVLNNQFLPNVNIKSSDLPSYEVRNN